MLDASDRLDLRGLAVGAPVLPVLVVSAVSLTLHDVLLASVARVLVAHKAEGSAEGLGGRVATLLLSNKDEITFGLCKLLQEWTYAPHCTCMEPTSGIIQPMACRDG